MTMKATAILLMLLLLVVPAEAGLRGRCRRMEPSQVSLCHASGYGKAACRQALVGCCIAHGGTLCVFVPSTTTTTVSTTTTSTTTVPVVSTSTTIPGLFVQGPLNIDVAEESNPCGLSAPSPFLLSGVLTQNGTALTGSFATSLGQLLLTGTIDGPDSFGLSTGEQCGNGCCESLTVVVSAIATSPGGGFVGSPFVSYVSVCGVTSCTVLWY
jgi:hypothetical protein